MVSEDDDLIYNLGVEENIIFPLIVTNKGKDEIEVAVKELISWLRISTILNKTLDNNFKRYLINEENNKRSPENENSINFENDKTTPEDDNAINNENHEMPPERDLRDTQPTISVNYRVIKDNIENETIERNKRSKNNQTYDDWINRSDEW